MRIGRAWILMSAPSIVATCSGAVTAQDRAEQVIQNRIANFREIGTAYKAVGDALKSPQPNLSRIQESAQVIKDRGAQMLYMFPIGSEPLEEHPTSWIDRVIEWFSSDNKFALPDETKSHAKRAIWTERAKFEQAHAKFTIEADRMRQAASSGQADAISAQFRRLGETCKACHEVFREKID